MNVATEDPDLLLIAAMREPPALEEARSSLDFWQRRRSALPVYRRRARREASEMIGRWEERVLEAERLRYGTGLLGLLRRLLAGDVPSWWLSLSGLRSVAWHVVPRRLVVLAASVVAVWLLLCALALAAIASLLG
jgi:hypothetical protein